VCVFGTSYIYGGMAVITKKIISAFVSGIKGLLLIVFGITFPLIRTVVSAQKCRLSLRWSFTRHLFGFLGVTSWFVVIFKRTCVRI
jgi:hypothetical protein